METDSNLVNDSSTVAKAVPAECNVDIVLAIPVNGAANNADNRDTASDTSGTPVNGIEATTSIPSSITGTPIYQMGQACKEFVKKFYHTRGVYMSLIPYSGKLSISPDRADAWTTPIPAFNSSSTANQLMIGSCLYGTRGTKNAALTQGTKNYTSTPYYWGNDLSCYPIMCRRGTQFSLADYGDNCFHGGKLLDTTNANNSNHDYRYMRMNLNPCYVGYANTLSMKCEKQCIHYLPNPYYMIEPTADLVKIYEMCNALYPIYDPYNVSNFVFAALEWSNNMFQSWTRNPSVSTTAGSGDDAVLSRPSKITSERKKAVILLINKPDWFEPGEMTYLGFNNDYSEVPVAESDKIDFSIDYSDTSQKFLDGTAYNSTYKGPKQILTMEKQSGDNLTRTNGYYECGEGKYRLKFPHKGTIKLTVAPAANASSSSGSGSITFYDTNIGSTYDVHKDSLSGSTITLGTAQTVTGSQTFVFSGGVMPTKGTNNPDGVNSTEGKNFSHNLSVKKVKYSVSDQNTVKITNCILKKQIIRDYFGVYDRQNNYKTLILNNGTNASRYNTDVSCAYTPRSTFGYSSNFTVTWGSEEDINISKFRDSCIKTAADYYYSAYSTHYVFMFIGTSYTPLYISIYGISLNFLVSMGVCDSSDTWDLAYYNGDNGSYTTMFSECPGGNVWSTQYLCSSMLGYNGGIIKLRFSSRGSRGGFWQYYIQNQNDKTLQNTEATAITTNPIEYPDLIQNKGIYLANYNGEKWICFQGDGELHVTVKGGTSKPELTFGYVSGDTAAHEITDETTYVITPDKITGGSDGDYYIDLDMKALKLISAEITNRNCASIANPISATYVDDVEETTTNVSKTDTITFSSQTSGSNGLISYSTQSGSTSVVSGGRECTGSAKGRLSFPYKENGTVKLTVAPSSSGSGNDSSIGGTVSSTFSMDGSTWRWHYFSNALNASGTSTSSWNYCCDEGYRGFAMAYGNSKFAVISAEGYTAYSSNGGVTWSRGTVVGQGGGRNWNGMAWNGGYFVALTGYGGYVTYSSNGSSWSSPTCPLSGVYTGYLDDDLGWNGSYFFAKGDDNNMYMTSYSTGTSGWFKQGSVSSSLGDGEQHKYGGGYYVRFYPQNTTLRYETNVLEQSYSSYTLPLAPRALNYGPGYWLIITNYGAIMKSSGACPNSWTTINGGSSSSYLYSLSSNSKWCGICYGAYDGGRWVAYTRSGDVAVLTKTGATSTIQFSNTTTYTSQQTVSSQTTYTFNASQITGGSAGNYYFDFDMSNIKLVSATITCDVPTTTVSAGDSVTKTVADVIDFTNGNKTSKNVLAGTSTRILTTTISGSTSNSLYKVSAQTGATISSAVRGKLKLTLYPATNQAAIRLRKGSSDTTGLYQTITGRTVVEVPDEYLLADTSDPTRNKCSLTINFNQVYVLNATLTSWTPRYNKISLPKRSSAVDYSQSVSAKPVYNSDLVVYGQDIGGSVRSTTTYDSNLGYWCSTGGYNNFFDMQLYSKNDFYFLLEDVYSTASRVETCWNIGTSGDTRTTFYRPGLTRIYSDYTKHLSQTGYGITGKEQFVHAGFTQPINTALYNYGTTNNIVSATNGNFDNYVNPSSDFNRTVMKQLTTDACTKLKDAGARVYVVKYKHQKNWGALTRLTDTTYKTSPTAHSYTEIDNCAANSGGFIREAANENALKEVLDEIATDIKSSGFANYKEAELK